MQKHCQINQKSAPRKNQIIQQCCECKQQPSQNQNIIYFQVIFDRYQQQSQNIISEANPYIKKRNVKPWATQQIHLLFQLYLENGPEWSKISLSLQNKDQFCIKNKFNSILRKGIKNLSLFEKNLRNKSNKNLTSKNINGILQFSYQTKKIMSVQQLKINYQSTLFKTRHQIIDYFRRIDEYSFEDKQNLIINIRKLNKNLRCFTISKEKNIKSCRVTIENLRTYNKVDQLLTGNLLQTIEKLAPKTTIKCQNSGQQNIKCLNTNDQRTGQIKQDELQLNLERLLADVECSINQKIKESSCYKLKTYEHLECEVSQQHPADIALEHIY